MGYFFAKKDLIATQVYIKFSRPMTFIAFIC